MVLWSQTTHSDYREISSRKKPSVTEQNKPLKPSLGQTDFCHAPQTQSSLWLTFNPGLSGVYGSIHSQHLPLKQPRNLRQNAAPSVHSERQFCAPALRRVAHQHWPAQKWNARPTQQQVPPRPGLTATLVKVLRGE